MDVAASFSYALLRQPYLRPRRCGDLGFVSRHKPAEHHIAMFLHLQTLRRHVSRPVAAGVSLSLKDVAGVTVCLQLRRSYFVLPCFFLREWFFLHVLLTLMATMFSASQMLSNIGIRLG